MIDIGMLSRFLPGFTASNDPKDAAMPIIKGQVQHLLARLPDVATVRRPRFA